MDIIISFPKKREGGNEGEKEREGKRDNGATRNMSAHSWLVRAFVRPSDLLHQLTRFRSLLHFREKKRNEEGKKKEREERERERERPISIVQCSGK